MSPSALKERALSLLQRPGLMMAFTAVSIMGFWLLDAAVDYLVHYDEPLTEVLFPGGKELAFRVLFSFFLLLFGSVLSWIVRLKADSDSMLLESQERYRELVEFTSAVHWEMDVATMRYTYISPQIKWLTGYPADRWADFNFWSSCLHPDDGPWAPEHTITKTRLLMDHEFDYRIVSAGGRVVWIRQLVNVIHERGRPVKLRGMMLEVTRLKQAEAGLREALAEQEALLKEMHGRVKSNMSVIMAILNLQLRQLGEGPARVALEKSCNRIMAMARVHEKMYASQDISRVDVRDYLKGLVTGLAGTYGAASLDVGVDVVCGVPSMPPDKLIPCGLMVNELVTNCLLHAFEGREGGTVLVELLPAGGAVRLRVSDDGRGLPEGVEICRNGSGGLGSMLVSSLARQLDGEVQVSSDGGTSVSVTFP